MPPGSPCLAYAATSASELVRSSSFGSLTAKLYSLLVGLLRFLGLLSLVFGVSDILERIDVQLFAQQRQLFRFDIAHDVDEDRLPFAFRYQDHDSLHGILA